MIWRSSLRWTGLYLLVALIFLFSTFPFYWAIVTSIKSGSALFQVEFWPPHITWQNYRSVFLEQPFGRNIINSVGIATVTVLLSLAIGVFASYPLARKQFKGRSTLLFTFLGVSMFPQIAVLSGLFELIRSLGLYDTWPALILSYTIFTLPFTIWVLTTFMRDIPRSIEEAAVMDGAKPWVIIFRVLMPLLAPSMVTIGLLSFIAAWNEFLFALTLTLTNDARTVPVAIALMSGATQHELPWGPIMAASVVVTIPLIALVLIFQRYIVAGLTAGSVKG